MKNFYSILYASPNPTANESLAIGLLVVSPSFLWVQFSQRKIKLVKSLIESDVQILDWVVKSINNKVEEQNNRIKNKAKTNLIFETESFIQSEYIEYLNQYNNNLLHFSKPIAIQEDIREKLCNTLFGLLVSEEKSEQESVLATDNDFYAKIDQNLIHKVQSKVHTHVQFNSKVLPSLYFSYEMECIGLNGVFTGAKVIDFNKKTQTIDAHLSHYFALSELLERKYQKHTIENNFFIIADEPEQKKSREHVLWNQIHEQDKFKIISSDESEMVVDKIEQTGAYKFLEEIE